MTASGINGVLQFGLGALASSIVSLSASTSAMTMNATMAVSGLASFAVVLFLLLKHIADSSDGALAPNQQEEITANGASSL